MKQQVNRFLSNSGAVKRQYVKYGPEEFVKSDIKLSISIMVSNRIDTIEKCLSSIKPILDELPSELIVVDTVGEENSDGSLEVAKKYADKIVHFDWCNDFAKARNAGLNQCRGEWFMFMDDDEWFEDPTELIEFFKSGECNQYLSAAHVIRNYTQKWDDEVDMYLEGHTPRLVRMHRNQKFVFSIHESLEPFFYPTKHLSCYSHHFSYSIEEKNKEELEKRNKRNLQLLLEELKNNKNDVRILSYLFTQYRVMGEIEKASEVCDYAIKNVQGDFFQGFFAAMQIDILVKELKFDEVLEKGRVVCEKFKMNTFIRMLLYLNLTFSAYKLDLYDKVVEYSSNYFELLDYYRNNRQIVLTEPRLSSDNYSETAIAQFQCFQNLLYASNQIKKHDEYNKALYIVDFTRLYELATNVRNIVFTSAIDTSIELNDKKAVSHILNNVIKGATRENKEKFHGEFLALFYNFDENKRLTLIDFLAEGDVDDPVVSFLSLMSEKIEDSKVKEIYQKYKYHSRGTTKNIPVILMSHEVNPNEALKDLTLSDVKNIFSNNLQSINKEKIKRIQKCSETYLDGALKQCVDTCVCEVLGTEDEIKKSENDYLSILYSDEMLKTKVRA